VTSIFWHEIPFVRICIPFVAGILVQQVSGVSYLFILTLVAGMLMVAIGALIRDIWVRQQIRTVTLTVLMFGTGAFIRHSVDPDQKTIQAAIAATSSVTAMIHSAGPSSYGTKATLSIISTDDTGLPDRLRMIAYVRDTIRVFSPGDTVVISAVPEIIPAASNPFAFDISQYYRNQGIHLRAFVDAHEILAHQPATGFGLRRRCEEVRTVLSGIIQAHIQDRQISGVLEAMVLGVRDGIDDELKDAYAKSGAIHILAISGLHVGIVSFILFILIGKVRRKDHAVVKAGRVLVLLTGIWAFAGIAGLSPSVTRAACMFSIYLLGMMMRRSVKGLNVLACTALVFLCVDPLQLNSLSFQFSYLALAGILIFYKPIHRLYEFNSRAAKFIWSTMVMSIAAQLFLIPFLIYYFHQVSLVSLLSGLVAIPAAYAILCGGLILFLLHFITPAFAGQWAQLLQYIVRWTNEVMIWFSKLPMSHLADLYLPGAEIAILFSMVLCASLRLLTKQRFWLYSTCLLGLLLGIVHQTTLRAYDLERIAVYKCGTGEVGMDYVAARICYSTIDIASLSGYQAGELKSFRHLSRVRQTLQVSLLDTSACIRLLDLPYDRESNSSANGNSTDTTAATLNRIAIVTSQCEEDLDQMLIQFSPDQVLLAPGVSKRTRKEIAQICATHQIPIHDLYRDGSYYLIKQKKASNEASWQYISG
jgi:competence protein ComEC